MAHEEYKQISLRPESLALIELCNQVITRYQAQGLRLTLRQLYYQLVTINAIKNEERAYKRLGAIVSDGRLAGLIDWQAIEDRMRQPTVPNEYRNLGRLIEAAVYSYRLPRWEGQDFYVELWVEKDALAGVLAPLADEFHITLMVNRGYSSQSAMYEAAKRFRGQFKERVLLYLGDHDPSGEDMVRDVGDRLAMFGADVEVRKVALTMDQVQAYNPPPNPTKLTDSRAEGYIGRYGEECWEVDALPPDVLAQLIRAAMVGLRDENKVQAILKREQADIARLRRLTDRK